MKRRFISLILCLALISGVLQTGLFSLPVFADEDYTDPEHPYIATNFSGLQAVFEKERPAGTTVYIKLGRNIEDAVKHRENFICLKTNGADVVIDLCGYKLGIGTENDTFIYAYNGSVTFNDSQRYDESLGMWVGGIVEYELKDLSWDHGFDFLYSRMLEGNVTINGGSFRNVTKKGVARKANYVYEGRNFKMYGGIIECENALWFGSPADVEIGGGTIIVKGEYAFSITMGSDLQQRLKIKNLHIKNGSGSSQIIAFNVSVPDSYAANHTGSQAIAEFGKIFPSGTNAFIDGVKQPTVTSGMVYTGAGSILGPVFSDDYVIYPSVGINELSVTIQEPRPGDTLHYDASVPAYSGYFIDTYTSGAWQNGVIWKNGPTGKSIMHGAIFETGNTYTVRIMVTSSNPYIYVFAEPDEINAYINGRPATVTRETDSTYRLEYTYVCPGKTDASVINITMPEPAEGAAIPYTFDMPEENGYENAGYVFDDDDEFWHNGVRWMKNGENIRAGSTDYFTPGNTYTVSVAVRPTGEPWFSYVSANNMNASVNGKTASVSSSVYCHIISCSFTLVAEVDSIRITVDTPTAYGTPVFSASAPAGAAYAVEDYDSGYWQNGVRWRDEEEHYYMEDEDTFAVGNHYTVAVSVVIADTERFRFADVDSVNAAVNGKPAEVIKASDTNYILYYTFTVADPRIELIEITMPEPEAGGAFIYEASVPDGRGYGVEDYTFGSWKNGVLWANENGSSLDTDGVFESGKSYTVTVSIEITDKDNFYFAGIGSTAATVNGKEATVRRFTSTNYGVDYTFTIPKEDVTVNEITVKGFKVPAAGQTVNEVTALLTVPDGAPYEIGDCVWESTNASGSLSGSYVFESDYIYNVFMYIVPKSGYRFSDDPTVIIEGGQEYLSEINCCLYPDGQYGIWLTEIKAGASSDIKYGDVNNDGKINGQDLIRLRKHLNGENVVIGPGANVNGDPNNVVNGLDLIRLRKYLNGEDVVLGPK